MAKLIIGFDLESKSKAKLRRKETRRRHKDV
jgi:hypothetical protein